MYHTVFKSFKFSSYIHVLYTYTPINLFRKVTIIVLFYIAKAPNRLISKHIILTLHTPI